MPRSQPLNIRRKHIFFKEGEQWTWHVEEKKDDQRDWRRGAMWWEWWSVFASWSGGHTAPQTGWLKATQAYCLQFWRLEWKKLKFWHGPENWGGKEYFLSLLASGVLAVLGALCLVDIPLQSLPLSYAVFFCVSLCLFSSSSSDTCHLGLTSCSTWGFGRQVRHVGHNVRTVSGL